VNLHATGQDVGQELVTLRTGRASAAWCGAVEHLGSALADLARASGIPTVRPAGGHAVYLDAARLLPHIPPSQYPAQALACAIYTEGGVRGVEIGSVMFGKPQADGTETSAPMELVRLAIPRRTYTQSHIDYVGEVLALVAAKADRLTGLRIVEQAPWLRHFTAKFASLP
jgi:tryptophanase